MSRSVRSCFAALAIAISPLALFQSAPAHSVYNAMDAVPGATVLIPYFEVDTANANGSTTLVSVVNSSASAMMVRVTLWSDANLPVYSFPVYLTGYDVASINMRDILNGNLPVTASAGQDPSDTISPQGPYSQDINFASCTAGVGSGLNPLPLPAMSASQIADVRAALTGSAVPNATLTGIAAGQCVGRTYGDNVARGYITMDTVNSCLIGSPADGTNYFNNVIATNQNALWGDYMVVDPGNNFAYGDLGTMLESTSATAVAGSYTFYGRFVGASGSDKREGLASQWAIHADRDSSQLQYWRDTRIALNPGAVGFTCGNPPSPQPMGHDWAGAFRFDSYPEGMNNSTLFGTPIAKVELTNANTGMTTVTKIGQIQASLNTTIAGQNVVVFNDASNLTQSLITAVRKPKSGAGRFMSGAIAFPLDQVANPSDTFISFPTSQTPD